MTKKFITLKEHKKALKEQAKQIFKDVYDKAIAEYEGATTWYLLEKEFLEIKEKWVK